MNKKSLSWAAPGDVNAFFGLMLDNLAGLVLTVTLLAGAFGFPAKFAMRYMIPGTAIGVLVGDFLFFLMALALSRKSGRDNVTAMPLGLDTPSTFGMIFMVLGPAFLSAKAAMGESPSEAQIQQAAIHAWHIGVCCIVFSGLLKLAFAGFAGIARRVFPRAGLLGSLAAISLVLITFFPILEIFSAPLVGLVSLAIILTTLIAHVSLPARIPGALGAVLVGGLIYYLALAVQQYTGLELMPPSDEALNAGDGLLPTEWTSIFPFQWTAAWRDAINYLPIVTPFAIATVVGGIDCTESAAAAGDEYSTGGVIAVEAVATLIAGLCGGVIQTTPYIGHPAYKTMGGRAAYTLATALFIGSAGLLGYFGFLYIYLPKVAIVPILVFVGLEIGAQSFSATPVRHYTAVALAMIPALAVLGETLIIDGILTDPAIVSAGITQSNLLPSNQKNLEVIHMLNAGFIITSLLWASALAAIIDRRLVRGGVYFLVCCGLTLVGMIHSPLPNNELFLLPLPGVPANTFGLLSDPELTRKVLLVAAGYGLTAVFLFGLARVTPSRLEPVSLDQE